jgi:hypothetical protein
VGVGRSLRLSCCKDEKGKEMVVLLEREGCGTKRALSDDMVDFLSLSFECTVSKFVG